MCTYNMISNMKSLYESIFDIDNNIEEVNPWGEIMWQSYKKGELDKALEKAILDEAQEIKNPETNARKINKQLLLLVKGEPTEENAYSQDPYDALVIKCKDKETLYIDFRHLAWRNTYTVPMVFHEALYSFRSPLFENGMEDVVKVYGIEKESLLVRALRERLIEIERQ